MATTVPSKKAWKTLKEFATLEAIYHILREIGEAATGGEFVLDNEHLKKALHLHN